MTMSFRRLLVRLLSALPGGSGLVDRLRRWRQRRRAGGETETNIDPAAAMRELVLTIILAPGQTLSAEYDGFRSVQADAAARHPERVYYAPPAGPALLSPAHLSNLLLSLRRSNVDLALASFTLDEPPAVLAAEARAVTIFSDRAFGAMMDGKLAAKVCLSGRVLRLLPAPAGAEPGLKNLQQLFPGHAVAQVKGGPGFTVGQGRGTPLRGIARHRGLPSPEDPRPVIFCLPIFLAVGGVERNTIEIVRALRDRYRFVVITTERLSRSQGSLHHQMGDAGGLIYDLAEIAGRDLHLDLLGQLKAAYRPSLVWICNGSPWLVDQAPALRALFADCGIVDQQVYDTDVGWIEFYGRPDIQAFDRFIAVNQRIRDEFTNRFKMDPGKIDLIYSAIDAPRFDLPRLGEAEKAARARTFGLPPGRPVFAFIGRLAEQKRPLEFLKIADHAQAENSGDFFLLVGDGPLNGDCESYMARHDLKNVARIPFCDDLTQLYPLLAGLLITSKYEGLPIAMLEALAMGVPVFSTDVGDIRLVLQDHGNGRVFAGPDLGRPFIDACAEWRRQSAPHGENARRAAADIRARFSVTAIAKQYEECWRQAIAARSAIRPPGDLPSS